MKSRCLPELKTIFGFFGERYFLTYNYKRAHDLFHMKKGKTIHVRKVQTARDTPIKRHLGLTTLDYKPKTQMTSRSKYSNFIPPYQLQSKAIAKLEKSPRNEGNALKFLTQPSQFSDPNSIQYFIVSNGISIEQNESALKIQKAWRRMKTNKKMLSFVHFLVSFNKTKIRYSFHFWQLSRRYPADIAINHYKLVVNHMKTRSYLYLINDEWITTDSQSKLLTFNQYCKTNCILINKNYDIEKIIKFVKIMMRSLMKETISVWHEMKEDSKMFAKQRLIIQNTLVHRSLFKQQFWTYIFWRRWAMYRKTKNMIKSSVVCHSFYLFEWSAFRAKYQKKQNIIHKAHNMRNVRLMYYSFSTLRSYSISRIKHREEFNKIQRVAIKYSMSLAFQAFMLFHVKNSIDKSLKYRVLSSWYKVIDTAVIHKACLSTMLRRKEIQILFKTFSQWRENIFNESLFMAFLFDHVEKKQLLALMTCFCLKQDFVHYYFVSSFKSWKNIITMKKRAKQFVTWSFEYSSKESFKYYLLDMCHEYCLHQFDFFKYLPFKSEFDKKFTSIVSNSERASLSAARRKSKLLKVLQKLKDLDTPVKYFPTTVKGIIRFFNNINDYTPYEGDWAETATSEQVKTLLFRLIIAVQHHCRPRQAQRTFNINQIRQFKYDKKLETLQAIRIFRQRQEETYEIKRKAMVQRLNRDALILAKKDVYLALLAMKEVNPKFKIESDKIFESKTIKEEGKDKKSNLVNNDNANQILMKKPPLLDSISQIKKGITKSNRKARRNPKQIFTEETNQSAKNRDNPLQDTTNKRTIQSSIEKVDYIYEKYKPITKEARHQQRNLFKNQKQQSADNFPPKLDTFPTITTAPPFHEKPKEDEPLLVYNNSQMSIDEHSHKLLQNSDLMGNFAENKHIDEAIPEIEIIEEEDIHEEEDFVDHYSEIDKIYENYVNQTDFLQQNAINRRDQLTNRYFEILDILLTQQRRIRRRKLLAFRNKNESTGNLVFMPDDDDDEFQKHLRHDHIWRVLRGMMPPKQEEVEEQPPKLTEGQLELLKRKENRLKRRPLFEDKSNKFETVTDENGNVFNKSNCSEFSKVLFVGDAFLPILNLGSSEYLTDEIYFDKERQSSRSDDSSDLSDSSFDIPGLSTLVDEINIFLTNRYALSIDEQEQLLIEMAQKETDPEEAQKKEAAVQVMRAINRLARTAVKDQATKEADSRDINHITLATSMIRPKASETNMLSHKFRESLQEIHWNQVETLFRQRTLEKIEKIEQHKKQRETRSYLRKKETIIDKKKIIFSQDLLNAIHEGARIAHPIIMKYYHDVSKIDPFEGLPELRERINKLRELERQNENLDLENQSQEKQEIIPAEMPTSIQIQDTQPLKIRASSQIGQHEIRKKRKTSNQAHDVYAEEYIISIGGRTPRKTPKKIKRSVTTLHKKKSMNHDYENDDYLTIDNITIKNNPNSKRPKTSRSKVKQTNSDTNGGSNSEIKQPNIYSFQRPKIHVTKMAATIPAASPEFTTIAPETRNKLDYNKTSRLKKVKWVLDPDPKLTDDDITFFLFSTPFIFPPAVINQFFDQEE